MAALHHQLQVYGSNHDYDYPLLVGRVRPARVGRGSQQARGGKGSGGGRGRRHYWREGPSLPPTPPPATPSSRPAPAPMPRASPPAPVERPPAPAVAPGQGVTSSSAEDQRAVPAVFEHLHLLGPFLTTAELLSLSALCRSTRAYLSYMTDVTIGEPPPSSTKLHLHALLTRLTKLKTLRLTSGHSLFHLTWSVDRGGGVAAWWQQLSVLDLSHARLWAKDEARLLGALDKGGLLCLRSLVLADTGIGDRGTTRLAGVLSSGRCPALERLDLSDNNVRLAVKDLGASLGGCPSLTSLSLSGNVIGQAGVRQLLQGLQGARPAPPGLEELELVETGLQVEGAIVLQDFLDKPPLIKLRSLRLNGNGMGSDGVSALCEALGRGGCPDLRRLDLGANQVGAAGVAAFVGACEAGACRELEQLNLSFNYIPVASLRDLWRILVSTDNNNHHDYRPPHQQHHDAADEDEPHQAHHPVSPPLCEPLKKLRHIDVYMNDIPSPERKVFRHQLIEAAPHILCYV